MHATTTIIRQSVACHPRIFSNFISRNSNPVFSTSVSTWSNVFRLLASTLPSLSTSWQATPPQPLRAGYDAIHTTVNLDPKGVATFTSASGVLRRFNMLADDEYMDFLNKANEDPSAGSAKTQTSQGKKQLKAADVGVNIPQALVKVTKDAFYMSDSDEPFVPVSLAWEKGEGLPNEEEIARVVEHWDPTSAEVEILDPIDWDRNGQYKDIVEAVQKAGKGNDVRVYRIAKDSSRAEYFVITRQGDGKDARLVGVKALAIES